MQSLVGAMRLLTLGHRGQLARIDDEACCMGFPSKSPDIIGGWSGYGWLFVNAVKRVKSVLRTVAWV